MAREHHLDRLLLSAIVDTSTADRPRRRVRSELPVQRVVTLVVCDLEAPGDPARAAAPVRGVRFEVEAGSIALLTPARAGRTVILCLAGDLPRTAGTVETGDGHARHHIEATSWHLAVSSTPMPSKTMAGDIVAAAGPPSRRAAERLGLGPMLTSFVNELDAPHRILLGFAAALGPNPDIVALDDPASDLDDHQVAQVMDAVRDLVDVEGRTVLIASDLHALPAGLRPLVDRIVELTPPAEE